MKRMMLILVFLVCTFVLLPKNDGVKILEGVLKPEDINIDPAGKYLYITENTTIHIYDLKTLKFVKTFGQTGEGPREFKNFASLCFQEGKLVVNSAGKMSFFDKLGEFISETRCPATGGNGHFSYINGNFVGIGNRSDKEGVLYQTLNLYDKNLKKIREIYAIKAFMQVDSMGKIFWPPRRLLFRVHDDLIITAGKPGFRFDLFNGQGKLLKVITRKDYQAEKFTDEDEQNHREFLKKRYKERYNQMKRFLEFPKYHPPIKAIVAGKNQILILTFKRLGGKMKLIRYNYEGRFLGTGYVKVKMQNPVASYPFTISGNRLYQIVETDNEKWELSVNNL